MYNKIKTLVLCFGVGAFVCPSWASDLTIQEVKHSHDVFKTSEGVAKLSYTYDSFLNWQKNLSGRFFDLEPAPVLKGLAEGVKASSSPSLLDVSDYELSLIHI